MFQIYFKGLCYTCVNCGGVSWHISNYKETYEKFVGTEKDLFQWVNEGGDLVQISPSNIIFEL